MRIPTCIYFCWICMTVSRLSGQALPAGTASPATVTVGQAVAETLANNPALMAERANIPIAEAVLITARLRPNPLLSAGGDHLPLLNTRFNEENAAGPSEFNLRTDFPWERGGKRRYRVEVAENSRASVELSILNAARNITLDVQRAFVDAWLAKESLSVARQNMASLNQIVEVNQARYKAGDIAELEFIRSRLAAVQFQTTVRQWEFRVRTALIELQTLMGRPRYLDSFDITGGLRMDPKIPSQEELHTLAGQSRPDLRSLERDLARAKSNIQLQLAHAKMDVSLGTEYRRQQGVNGTGNSLGFFLSIPLPVYDRNQGEIERARQEERQVQLRIRALQSVIGSEVETAYQQLLTSRALLEDIENRMLRQAHIVREITEYSYRRGEATLLEFLDAQRAYNDTMQGYSEARAEFARSLYLIDAVTGKAPGP
jgi:cobalt-zinc-cadmium efflux system outer membrane protein